MRVSGNGGGVGAAGLGHDLAAAGLSDELAAADRLIADLAVLLDAGLVVVDEHILGPARYGVAPVADHREKRQASWEIPSTHDDRGCDGGLG